MSIPVVFHNSDYIPIAYIDHTHVVDTTAPKYIYCICTTGLVTICGRNTQSDDWIASIKLDQHIIQKVKNNDIIILIDDMSEGFNHVDINQYVKSFCELNGLLLHRHNIIYATSNMNFGYSEYVSHISDHFILNMIKIGWFTSEEEILYNDIVAGRKFKKWDYKFVSLQQRPRDFRVQLYNNLRDTWSKSEAVCTLNDWLNDWGNIIVPNKSKIPTESSPYEDDTSYKSWRQVTKEHFINIPYAIVSETSITQSQQFITEKVIKNLIYPQPFVLCGYLGCITTLQDLGFNTYSEVDHSYNHISTNYNNDELINNAVTALTALIKLPVSDKCYDVVEYNRQLIKTEFNTFAILFKTLHTKLFQT